MKEFSNKIAQSKFLITGGAGFIGSNLVEYLLKHNAKLIRVLDNLSNGYLQNVEEYLNLPNFEFVEGDIRDLETCKRAVEGVDYVSHQAALGSVPRSIENPIRTNEVNITGFLNMLEAIKGQNSIKGFVYAASSSTYGDSQVLPKKEGNEGNPISPYAVTKAVNEMYADVFSRVYNISSAGLRYFNIFGPKQNPNNPYAAVIPIFCNSFIQGQSPTINGDGETSRDFTYVENAVQANIRAMLIPQNGHKVYNVACGEQASLNDMIIALNKISSQNIQPNYGPERPGDVKHSKADISKIKNDLGYQPSVYFKDGLKKVYEWYKVQTKKYAGE
jgi:UDP-N-acetylglucosamine 4-epimerase